MIKLRLFSLAGRIALISTVIAVIAVQISDNWITKETAQWQYDSLDGLPASDVALVLGCAAQLANGHQNLYFRHRIDTAAKAYQRGKCRYLLVSGDNSSLSYNEPRQMREALIARGVPASRIICDYAGLRTLDSVVRADKVFGQRSLLVISQSFHNERAVYIARHFGMEMVGLAAPDVTTHFGWRTRVREKLARVKTLLDLYALSTEPRFLGDPVRITRNL